MVESVISPAAPIGTCAADGRHEPCPRGHACPYGQRCSCLCLSLPAVPVIHAQSTARELNDAGWKMIERGDGARAARFFADALVLEPDEPVLLLGAGAAAHLAGRPKDALAHLRRALDINPRLTQAALLLGEIAYSEGDVAMAIATLEKTLNVPSERSRPDTAPHRVAGGSRPPS